MTASSSSRNPDAVLRLIAIGLGIIAAVMLVAMIFYPFGYDQAVFAVGGKMVLAGKVPVRDFLDTKPPVIFYIYSAALAIFGNQEWSIRAFDIIFQFATAFYFFGILRRYLSFDVALISVALTMILYAGSGFWMTDEAESFALLLSLILVDVTLRSTETRGRSQIYFGLIAGVAAFALLMLKFTLVLGAVAAIVFILLQKRNASKDRWQFVVALVVTNILLIFGFVAWLRATNSYEAFAAWLHWLSSYAGTVRPEHSRLYELFVRFPERFIYSATPLVAILGVLGLVMFFRRKGIARPLLSLLLLTFVFQLLGIALEQKIEFPYQYTRALWGLTPFAAIGLERAITRARLAWRSRTRLLRLGIVVIVLVVIVLSPLARIATQTIPWVAHAIRGNRPAEVQRRIPDYFAAEQKEVGSYLKQKMSPNDQLFFWGNDVAIYFFTDRVPQTICLTATPLRTAATPAAWRDTLLAQLISAPPKYFIAEFGDTKPYITGSQLDSYGALLQWTELTEFLAKDYSVDSTIGHFFIFRRRA